MITKTDAQRIAREMEKCKHFNGVQNKTCKAGVEYDSFEGQIPCIGYKDEKTETCDKIAHLTEAEATAEVAEDRRRITETLKALAVVSDDAKAKGLKTGHGGADSVKCPICPNGTIKYSVASVNGHIWAGCSTPGCVRWMQ